MKGYDTLMLESIVHGYFPFHSQLNRHRSQHTDTYCFVLQVGLKIPLTLCSK